MSIRIERRVVPNVSLDELDPLLARVYAARGVTGTTDVDYKLSGLLSFHTLTDIDAAATLLSDAIMSDKRVLIVGDFDADGATSCAVAVRGLRLLGAGDVDFLIPNRFEYGYGLTPEIVEVAHARAPDLLVTVDNGISSLDGVQRAAELGMPVLVTDHHLPGAHLPAAAAIVNPNQPADTFPSKCIAGVGVMFYVLMATRAKLRELGWFAERGEPNLASLLDLVALGTVADLVRLDRNNRLMVSQGLQRIRNGRCQPGIKALLRVADRNFANTSASDLGFAVAPRLNAAGRLSDMSVGVRALISEDGDQAMDLARQLDRLNRERRSIEAQMHAQAMQHLDDVESMESTDNLPVGLCLYDKDWHPGVIGILASRVKALVHRPVIAFAPDTETSLRGSARSVDGFHIRDALEAIASANPGLIKKFGGHAMAAGLTIEVERYAEFADAFNEVAERILDRYQLQGVVLSDGVLSPDDLTLDKAEVLKKAGPWGQGFPEPMFDGEFRVSQCQLLKDRHLKMTVRHLDSDRPLTAIKFNLDPDTDVTSLERVHLAYRLDANEFRGNRRLNLIVEHLEALGS